MAFGSKGNVTNLGNRRSQTNEDFVASEYWLNIGYNVEIEMEDGGMSTEFIRLNRGIPLDHIKMIQSNSSNQFFNMKIDAQNAFLNDIRESCKPLQPGESRMITTETGLVIELHRIKSKREETNQDDNPYLKKFAFTFT